MSLDWGLEGKTVIVTGASSGIGAATARELGSVGASVVLVGRDAERLSASAADVEGRGGRAQVVFADLADADQAVGVVDEALAAFGSLHGIVHTASLFDPRPIEDTTLDCLEAQWRTNVAAPLLMTRAALPHLRPGSSVVFISSTVASVGFTGCSAYSATKGAVNAVSQQLAVELAPRGIRVNAVSAGVVETGALEHFPNKDAMLEMGIRNPVGRLVTPEDVAGVVTFLCSPEADMIRGQTIVIDGGWSLLTNIATDA
jgi:NAD(P)-dependent dehydrogenase (short-subunit alcohol dehydrogenase family)